MRVMANLVGEAHGDILEVGFGMGISATHIQECGVHSHTIIECNDDVVAAFQRWRTQYPDRDIRVIHGEWQQVLDQLGTYDGVFFDAYPTSEDEFQRPGIFAEPFFPTAAAVLRRGGVFTYFTSEADSLSRTHQRLLLQSFGSFSLSVVRSLAPPEDCTYWWADSMAVVKAIK
ncbi:MAG: class I SAM-dependent methyltransferase [Armatimonadota bacterium]